MKARADSVLGLHVSSSARAVSRERQLAELEQRIVQLFDQLHQPVQRYVRWIGLSEADADEVAQETFLRLVEHLRAGRDDEHLRAWVYRVAHNLTVNLMKSRRLADAVDDHRWNALAETYPDPGLGPEEQLLRRERFTRLAAGLGSLSAQQRECVYLRSEGFKYREIADILAVAVPTVGESLRRAIRKLMKHADD